MRELATAEVGEVSGAQDTWTFTGEPVSVANIEQIQSSLYSNVLQGATAGAVTGLITGPQNVLAGAYVGGLVGGMNWAISVSMYTPMVTYTPVITIVELSPTGGSDLCW